MDLRELFDDLSTEGEPPMSLNANEVYSAGRRRVRLRRTATAGVALAAAVVVTLAALVLATGPKPPVVAVTPTLSQLSHLPQRTSAGGVSGVLWADADDSGHVYADIPFCGETAPACVRKLVGSDDGGRTWQDRTTPPNAFDFRLLPNGVLVALTSRYPLEFWEGVYEPRNLAASTDGGRHWRAITILDVHDLAVRPGGVAVCLPSTDGASPGCTVFSVDLVNYSAAPLAAQPALASLYDAAGPRGRWLGTDRRATTLLTAGTIHGSGAVAMSTDAGRSWTTSPLGPACAGSPQIWPASSGTLFAVCSFGAEGPLPLYRSTDGGRSWQRQPVPQPVPFYDRSDVLSAFVLPDGTLMGVVYANSRLSTPQLWALRGGAWEKVTPVGLPDSVTNITRTAGGAFLAYAYEGGTFDLYQSTDLTRWTHITIAH